MAFKLCQMLASQGITAEVASAPLREGFKNLRDWLTARQDRLASTSNQCLAIISAYEFKRGKGLFWNTKSVIGTPPEIRQAFEDAFRAVRKPRDINGITAENMWDEPLGALRVNLVTYDLAYKAAKAQARENGFDLNFLDIEPTPQPDGSKEPE
ncbi:hypothetical protein DI396_11095 [Litorivita pollutaquae]|uniref:Uncharacterized protein n=2 Tax=Litorivita pollutaquae TaxID=2200892 RepID=A0A2V4MZI3_9RHOB|nr:hypothetical protein DI396_11095 [Litorivita pollutaquae]